MTAKHLTQLVLTDVQLAATMNAVQLAIVALRLHQDAQAPTDFATALSTGLDACDSFEPTVWGDVHNMLSIALEDASDPSLTVIAHVPQAEQSAETNTNRRFDPDLLDN